MNDVGDVQKHEEERSEHSERVDSSSGSLKRLVKISALVLLILLLLRIFVLAPYRIPTNSMQPTIAAGDAVIINKLPYYIRTPEYIPFTAIEVPHLQVKGLGNLERGDVVLFESTEPGRREGTSRLVKRCGAIPGDTVSLVNGVVLVNGKPSDLSVNSHSISSPPAKLEPMNGKKAYPLLRKESEVVVPYKGYELLLDSAKADAWKDVLSDEGIAVSYKNSIVFLNGRPATRYRFKHDYFFALGDNSRDSRDSRHYGFVPRENLIGQVMFIFWSHGDEGVRWGRIGGIVR
ncbi:MAG: signal peptidase I [Chlorobi bacterium]|nr:signal peptidase I [Chlorobiota bacterium]